MKQAVLANWDLPLLSVAALILFVVCFFCYTLWTYRKSNKEMYDAASFIPLNDVPTMKLEGK